MQPKLAFSILSLAAAALVAAPVEAVDPEIDWFTQDCGGGDSYSADVEVHGTAGQPDAGPDEPDVMTGGDFELTGGFWVLAFEGCDADLNDDGIVNGFDLALLLEQWTGAGVYAPYPPAQPADLNSDGKVDGFDLAILLGAWG